MDSISRTALLAFLGSVSVLAAPATAQQGSWAAARSDGATLQCGPREGFYTVAELPAGTLLFVEGREGDWARVRYPSGLQPMVPAAEVRLIDAGTVELTAASGLRAPSLLMGLAGSWRSVYPDKLPEGTRLRVVKQLTNADGQITGYQVLPPDPAAVGGRTATAYIRAEQLRPATQAEISAAGAAASTPVPTQPATPPVTQPAPLPVVPVPAGTPGTPTTPRAVPGATPSPAPAVPPAAAQPEETGPRAAFNRGVMPVQNAQRVDPAQAGLIGGVPAATLREVDASLEAARQLPPEQLDARLDELLGEYQRLRGLATDDGIASVLDGRIEWLRMRIATRDARRSLGRAIATSAGAETASAASIEQWRRSRGFGMVGRLLPSSVYDGRRLPQRFRLVSVDPVLGETTIGYIDPAADERLAGSVGLVIGVRGETRFDEATRLRTIDIAEMEVLGQTVPVSDQGRWSAPSAELPPVQLPAPEQAPAVLTPPPAAPAAVVPQPAPVTPAPASGGAIVIEPLN